MKREISSLRPLRAAAPSAARRLFGAPLRTLAALFLAGLAVTSCDKNAQEDAQGTPYNPNLPITVNSFTSDSGGIRTKVMIQGANFGSDTALVRVYFIDNEKERKAPIVNMNSENIYVLVPKQNGGNNRIKVKIGKDSVVTTKTFKYVVAQSLSNVVGLTGVAGSVDGSLADGRIQRTFGLAALGNDEVISFEMLNRTVRYISMNDNKITTLQTGFGAGQPAMNQQRNRLYAIEYTAPHKVIQYKKENLWAPEVLSSGIYRTNGTAVAGTIVAAALDDTEQWLYFRDRNGVFGRLELANPSNVQVLNETCGPVGAADYNYMVYSPVDDCFFFGVQNIHNIYKVSKDGQNVQLYAGSSQGTVDGPRLEAKFNSPGGMSVDSEGNLYVMDTNNNTVRKINRGSGYVSRIAGVIGVFGFTNGLPLESQMNYPYSICADDRDNYFIGESWGVTLRKLAIE
ncbi:IPT/TIG domain-containing protein [Paraflavisolibacter sp. H34]|uniref:IPT/TIG domain-containing protein n=1 Tax=Huijunlia imazamoxiresistens TaxID=3127457 RepID=UPI00301A6682